MSIDRIFIDPRIMGGQPCIRGTRIPVVVILKLLAKRESFEEIIQSYPKVTVEDIEACLNFAAWSLQENETLENKKASWDDLINDYTRNLERRLRALEIERQLFEVQRNKLEEEVNRLRNEREILRLELKKLQTNSENNTVPFKAMIDNKYWKIIFFDEKFRHENDFFNVVTLTDWDHDFKNKILTIFFESDYPWLRGLKRIEMNDKIYPNTNFFLVVKRNWAKIKKVNMPLGVLFEFTKNDLKLCGIGPKILSEIPEFDGDRLLTKINDLFSNSNLWKDMFIISAKSKSKWKTDLLNAGFF